MEWMDSTECREIYKRIVAVVTSGGKARKMDPPVSSLWTDLQKQNKLPQSTLTDQCGKELQEVMRQIDLMTNGQKKEWEREKDGLQSRLNVREKEIQMQKTTIEQKHKEIGQLKQQLDCSENRQRNLVTQYETQLSSLKGELQKLQRDYDRLHKRHTKQKKETEREREKSLMEIRDGNDEIQRLSRKVEEYRQRSKDWELDRRTQQKQIESLEAQRKAIADKCEFVQQQAQTYQAQLDKRREILDSTEFSLNSQIAQLEAKLNSTCESLRAQNSKVDKLKASLDEAMSAHKKAMDDNERLINDLKKATTNERKLEELTTELQSQLRSQDDFLRMSDEDSKQQEARLAFMEQQIAEKDKIIRNLGEVRNREESETVAQLRAELKDLQERSRLSQRNEKVLQAENSQLHDESMVKQRDCDTVNKKLEQKKADISRLEAELADLKSLLANAELRLTTLSGSHEMELTGVKDQLEQVTTELHYTSSDLTSLKEKAEHMEKQTKTDKEELQKKEAELKVANTQMDALRLENRHLRQTVITQTQTNLEHTEKNSRLAELQDSYEKTFKTLQQEKEVLQEDVTALQHEITTMEDHFDNELQRHIHEAELSYREDITKEQRRVEEIEEDSDRRVSMLQDRLDSTINRYEEQLQLLRRQKSRLEDELQQERRINSSYIQPAQVVYEEEDGGVVYVNDDMSLTETDSVNEYGYEMPGLGESASEKFLHEEEAHTKVLEDLIDSHIQQLKDKSDVAIKKHKR